MLEHLLVFVEEYSMEATLEKLLPKLLNNISFQIIRFQCKDDMLSKLPSQLKAYSSWIPDTWSILVLVDRDDDDCIKLKNNLENLSSNAGLKTKTRAKKGQHFTVTNRIIIEELESWFFGDWKAVTTAFPKVSSTIPKRSPYRIPDEIKGGTWEALERILKKAGYFATGLRKIECARSIAEHMSITSNQSNSFNCFRKAIDIIVKGSIA